MDTGWIKLHRKFLEWEWHQDPNMVALFLYILLEANHEAKRWKGVVVERGQTVFGRKSASLHTGISQRSIRTCLEKLKSTNEITIKSTNRYSIITLCNYNKYQTSRSEIDHQNDQQTGKQPTSNRPATDHKQELKNERSKEKNSSVFSLPPDINQETWDAFVEMRKLIKFPLTERGKVLILSKLVAIGQDKNAVLNQSVENSYRGVFPLKESGNGYKQQTHGKDEVDYELLKILEESFGGKHGTAGT